MFIRFSALLSAGLLASVAAVPSLAHAQAAAAVRPVSIGISGGAGMLQGSANDGYDLGYVVAGHLQLRPLLSPLGVRLDVGYANNAVSASTRQQLAGSALVDLTVLSGFANVVYALPIAAAPVRPYLLGGVGLGRVRGATVALGTDGGLSTGTATDTRFGFQVGAGIDIPLVGVAGFAEAGYQRFSLQGGSLGQIPIRFGIRF